MRNKFNQIPKPKPKAVANANPALVQQIDTKLQQGLALHNAGQLEEAKIIYDAILKHNPKNFHALQLSGTIAAQKKQWDKALGLFTDALKINTSNASVYNNCGIVLKELMRLAEALTSYNKAIELKRDYADAYYNRGIVLNELKRLEEALTSYDRAIEFKRDYANAYCNRGIVLNELKRLEEALTSYDRAIAIKPNFADAYYNRGIVFKELKRLEEALTSYDRAIEFKRDYADAYYNRGIVLHELKRLEEALRSYDRAIAIKPDYADAYWDKSLAFLLGGDFIKGFTEYEWRWKSENIKKQAGERSFTEPLWLGKESLFNKNIFIYSEQGLGDTLQFCRYAKLVAELGATVILEVQKPLVNVLQNLEGVDQLVARGSTLPEFDYHIPLMSLPLAFKTVIESIPNKIPYIHSNAAKEGKWRERIGETGFRIAICWQGSTKATDGVGRSFPVSLFEGLAKIGGVRLISLQKNEGVEQLQNLPIGMKIETLPDDFDSGENAFLDSAAVMKCVDLVITSDTALTHLAGALGVKTWLPLKYVPDWRWMLARSYSPWYPNHRLFRQTTRDDWTSVFNEMEAELISLASTKATTQQ